MGEFAPATDDSDPVARIGAALARAEAAAAMLEVRHRALRAATTDAVNALDRLIAEEQHG